MRQFLSENLTERLGHPSQRLDDNLKFFYDAILRRRKVVVCRK